MKKLLLILLVAISLNTFADSDIDFSLSDFCYEQSNVQVRNGIYFLPNQEIGITNISKCIFKNRNGQYHSKGRLLKGKKDGQWIYWNKDGTKWIEEYWKNGQEEKYTYWYGGNRFENTYKNGILISTTVYDSNERIVKETLENTPEFKSYEKSYRFHENGNLSDTYSFIDVGDGLVLHGKWESWYENGQKKDVDNYKYGVMIGHWTMWYENGQMSMDIIKNDSGEFDGTHQGWYENGQLAQVTIYSNGEVLSSKNFDETGKCIEGDCDE